jgi:hypothetical protein
MMCILITNLAPLQRSSPSANALSRRLIPARLKRRGSRRPYARTWATAIPNASMSPTTSRTTSRPVELLRALSAPRRGSQSVDSGSTRSQSSAPSKRGNASSGPQLARRERRRAAARPSASSKRIWYRHRTAILVPEAFLAAEAERRQSRALRPPRSRRRKSCRESRSDGAHRRANRRRSAPWRAGRQESRLRTQAGVARRPVRRRGAARGTDRDRFAPSSPSTGDHLRTRSRS